MAPESNPGPLYDSGDNVLAESPSEDDLLALVPDMELLENSTIDALSAHSAAAAAAGSGRKSATTPKLTDPNTGTTVRIAAPTKASHDDPYADLMPELEALEDTTAFTRTIPQMSAALAAKAAAKPPVAAPIKPPLGATQSSPAPRAAAPAARAPVQAAAQRRVPAAATPGPAVRTPPPATPKNLPKPESIAVPPVMDREFIARNRIVELYLSGSLPIRGASVFERFCRTNPQILDEIGLPERVHTALRLLDASGKPEPWQEKPKQFWERPYVLAAVSALAVVLGIVTLVLNSRVTDQARKINALHDQVVNQPLDAATASSTVYLSPTRAGPAAAAPVTVGGPAAQLIDFKLDLNHSDFRAFRVTIDRKNQGRVAVLNNLIKDSNGSLGFALNTSALGPDVYQLSIEGLDWRGDPQPDSWATINLIH